MEHDRSQRRIARTERARGLEEPHDLRFRIDVRLAFLPRYPALQPYLDRSGSVSSRPGDALPDSRLVRTVGPAVDAAVSRPELCQASRSAGKRVPAKLRVVLQVAVEAPQVTRAHLIAIAE